MGADGFFGYQDTGEKGFIEWSLGYTMDPIIECFQAVPEAQRRVRVLDKLSAPCCILGHIALNEENLLKGFAQGITEQKCPFPPELFDVFRPPGEEQLREAIPDSSKLVDYWRAVREDTVTYLRGGTDTRSAAVAPGGLDSPGQRREPRQPDP